MYAVRICLSITFETRRLLHLLKVKKLFISVYLQCSNARILRDIVFRGNVYV